MFDTHVNLHAEAFADDLEAVLARARDAGVTRFLAICDRFDNYHRVAEIAVGNADIWNSVGVHPHYAKDFTGLSVEALVEAAEDAKTVAIGETGLDFHYGYSAEAAQVDNFRRHIEASRKTGLPLIVHTREADDLTADILEDEFRRGPFPILLHCYTGGQALADRALDLGAYFSVSGILSFKNAKDVRAVIATIPLDRVILETDCPYLAPVPFRGRRNEPAFLIHVAEALAALHGKDALHVASVCEENALTLFKKISS
ncbi:TatD family deoxyribonuclease [Henriciella mobilis]|uniref:TatD family hydrolase n=1 Tax=Henriciella mobilis TaxID=2305467 RepID=UPI000E672E61|nr:TatD family hydrolase [Henriciella mobilis]RIJ15340.1 TatD family deoxyribonuclease [Henriciella mobilis]RIJ18804.1 TatD family deoxyribonuclease [Henriciella mobilis]